MRQSRIAFGMSDASTSPERNTGNHTDRRGRGKLHQPTDALRKQVEALASYGIPRDEIAKVAGICLNALVRHYGETLDIAATKANSLIAQSLFAKARGQGGCVDPRLASALLRRRYGG